MSRFSVIVYPIAVMMWILTLCMFINYMQDMRVETEAHYLSIAVNNSVDAAVGELLENSFNLDTDYTDILYAEVNPELALDEFCRMMCENLGYVASDENKLMVRNQYLDGFMVIGYDGYYEANPVKVTEAVNAYNGPGYDWEFKPKQPFTVVSGSNTYALNLGLEKARTFTGNEIVDVPLSSISNVISSYNSVTNTNNAKAIINSIVSDAFTKSVFLNTSTLLKVYNIPSGISRLANTNPIEGITVLAQVSGVRISTNKENQAFSVGGSKLTTANFVAAYTRSGIKYYVEVSKLTSAAKHAYPIDGSVKVYLTAQEAAKAGYSYDIYIRQFSN